MKQEATKILFVAFPFSIHTVRWIEQLNHAQWQVHLYSSHRGAQPHKDLATHIKYHSNPLQLNKKSNLFFRIIQKVKNKLLPANAITNTPEQELAAIIKEIQPNIIHSLESQHAGYLVSRTKQQFFKNEFPLWVHSNWGIDLHFFGNDEAHKKSLQYLLNNIDVFIAEGQRDVLLAKQMGFNKKHFVFPSVGGGFFIPTKQANNIAERKIILVKGTQDIVRRGLTALAAISKCAKALQGYEIILYNSCEETRAAADLLIMNKGLHISYPEEIVYKEMIALNAKARISLCINLSDGLPNAMVEAMMMGAFPIQTNTSLADEWITDGEGGFIVPADDVEIIADKLMLALTDDALVENAAKINYEKIASNLEYGIILEKTIKMYMQLLGYSSTNSMANA
jgi:glycosyltransferase involved in cell wall biosynthesis